MQCKDIPTVPILELLERISPHWAFWFEGEYSVRSAMPADVPDKLVMAKMNALIRRGLVSGCPCGCRGDYEIADKGRAMLAEHRGAVPASEHPYYVEAQ